METHKHKKHNNKFSISDDMSVDISTDNILGCSDIATSDTDNLTEELSSILGCFASKQMKNEIFDSEINIDSEMVSKQNGTHDACNQILKTDVEDVGQNQYKNSNIKQDTKNDIKIDVNETINSVKNETKSDSDNKILEIKIDMYQILQLVYGMKDKISVLESEINLLKNAPMELTSKLEDINKKMETFESSKTVGSDASNIETDVKLENLKKYIDEKILSLQTRFTNTKRFLIGKNKN